MASLLSSFEVNPCRNVKSHVIDVCSNSSCPGSSPQGDNYDVFLSFRGPDTRHSFTSFLYNGLVDAGVNVFKDDIALPRGEEILRSLMKAIEKCRVSIPIFSPAYASSKSCLHEIAKIYDCWCTAGQLVLPIFYGIEPSDVRKQTGPFEDPFRQYQQNEVDTKFPEKWMQALESIGRLTGETVPENQDQPEVVKKIVEQVKAWLATPEVPVDNDLFGMKQPVDAVIDMLQVSASDVRVVGICGMPGIGKSTLAKTLYNKLCSRFESCSFISDIGQGELRSLQHDMISQLRRRKFERLDSVQQNINFIRNRFTNKRVLIVLDDVRSLKQLEAFGVDSLPFGPGSRVILTTREPRELQAVKHAKWYTVQLLSPSHSLPLFLFHAFGKDLPDKEYRQLSVEIALSTGGIPEVIKFVGCILSNYRKKRIEKWEEVLQQLRKCDVDKLDELLRKSYGTLNEKEKKIFLDVACFLTRESRTIASYMWKDSDLYPLGGVENLLQMSLVNIGEDDELLMSDPIRQFGKKLVLEQHGKPRKRSRVWSHDDALEVLKDKKGAYKVEALVLQFESGCSATIGREEFEGLSQLKYLRLDRAKIRGDFENLLQQLRWLDWKNCPEISEEIDNFGPKELVILNVSYSNVTKSWRGWDLIMKKAKKLKVLLLAGCNHLSGYPPFPDGMELERLDFEGCSRLGEIIIPSDTIDSLVYLNMRGCRNLINLPPRLGLMKALEKLILDGTSIKEINLGSELVKLEILSACGCEKLEKISSSIGQLKSLLSLALDNTPIVKLPYSIGLLTKLETLSLRKCAGLRALPSSIGSLVSLVEMDLSYTAIKELPSSVEELKSLQILLMERTYLEKFPEAIPQLKSLRKIDFSLCRSMKGGVADGISSLSSLTTLMLTETEISRVPTNISELPQLQVLDLHKCTELQDLPSLPTSLTFLRVASHNMANASNLLHMTNLTELHLADSADEYSDDLTEVREPWPADSFQWIPKLSKLEILELHVSKIRELPVNFDEFESLKTLVLSCQHLNRLPRLPSGLMTLHLQNCKSLEKDASFSYLTSLSNLELDNCGVETIDLENVSELQLLKISDCGDLREISGIQRLSCLRKLTLSSCPCYQRPDLSKLEKMGLEVEEC